MKSIISLIVIFFTAITIAQTEGTTITIKVENVLSNKGKVGLGLYNEVTFMKALPLENHFEKIENGVAVFTIKNVHPGNYGIMCFHDENDNDKMDFESSGMPKENYGVSNNEVSFGPPLWENARFEVGKEDLELVIRM